MKCIVIGAGAWGLPAATELVRRGHYVPLADRHSAFNSLSSSSGPTRLWRLADPDPRMVRLSIRAVEAMRKLPSPARTPVYLRVSADVVVVGAGTGARRLLESSGIEIGLQPYLEQVVHFGNPDRHNLTDDHPCLFDGPTDEAHGIYAMPSPDGTFITEASRDGIVWATGDSGAGFKYSALMGDVLADPAEGRRPDPDIAALGLSRFAGRIPTTASRVHVMGR